MIHPWLMGLAALCVIGLIAACALMGRLDDPAPGDFEHEER